MAAEEASSELSHKAGLRRRLGRGLGAALYGRAVLICGQFLLVPMLIHGWGARGYGQWLALTAIASYVGYSHLGLTPALRSELSMAFSRHDRRAFTETYHTALVITAILLSSAQLIMIGLTHVLDFHGLLHMTDRSADAVRLIIALISLQVLTNIFSGVVFCGLSAVGRYAEVTVLDSTRQLVEFAAVGVLVLVFHQGFAAVALTYLSTAAITLVIGALMFRAQAAWVSLLPRAFMPKLFARLWRPMAGGLLLNFGYMGLVIQAPRVLLAAIAGPTAVAAFSIVTQLLRLTRLGGETIIYPMSVEFSYAYGRDDLAGARGLLKVATSAGLWLMLIAAVPVVLIGPEFIRVWTGGKIEILHIQLLAASVGAVGYALGLASMQALMAINRVLVSSMSLIVVAGAWLLLGANLAHPFGATGMLSAVAGLEATFSAVLLFFSARAFNLTPSDVWETVKPPFALVRQEIGRVSRWLSLRAA